MEFTILPHAELFQAVRIDCDAYPVSLIILEATKVLESVRLNKHSVAIEAVVLLEAEVNRPIGVPQLTYA